MALLKRDLHNTIGKRLTKLEGTLVKIADTVEKTKDDITAKEAELNQLEEQRRNNLLEGEVLYAAKDKQEIEKLQAELIRLNRTLTDYESMQQEAAREVFRKMYPTLVQYKDSINSELDTQTKEFIAGVKELYQTHLAGIEEKREQYNGIKDRWASISNSLGLGYIAANTSREAGYEACKVFGLLYDNLNDMQLMGMLNGIKRYIA